MPTLLPTSDLVAVAWISGVPGLSADMVSTNLPQDKTTWATTGFITVSTIAGAPHVDLPIRRPVVQVDCWAVNPNSPRPPWGKANALAEKIRDHVESDNRLADNFYRTLTFTNLGDYYPAAIKEAIMRTEPRRGIVQGMVPQGDEGYYAHYMLDLEIHWVVGA